ncbi:MAG: hypothetical protein GY854_25395 [Deltaproteobacteria bacterium]|nr:hypothetical protein [Deltaproteobacteria bacterium]
MDTASFSAIAQVMSATSPYGVLVILGWSYWRLNEKKDKEIKELNERMADLGERQVAAMTKMEGAIWALKEAIDRWG